MISDMEIKSKLKSHCELLLTEKIKKAETDLDVMYKSLSEETKSSAGDKYETGRAMLHIEIDKLKTYINEQQSLLNLVKKIDLDERFSIVKNGAIVKTNQVNYWIVASIGRVLIDNFEFFIISNAAPLAKELLGKKEKDTFEFNKNKITIENIY
jgi:transcription elongation GreA/GreB family factor